MRNQQNNPRYRFYWMSKGYSEEEAINLAKLECKKKSPRCIEYWLDQGYSNEDAKKKLAEKQNNGQYLQGRIVSKDQCNNIKTALRRIYTNEYWIEKGYSEEEAKNKIIKFKRRGVEGTKKAIAKKKAEGYNFRSQTHRCVEYWTKRGYTKEEAEIIISKNQARDLSYFISKYGIEEGTKRHKQRTSKWMTSFFGNNNMNEVNRKRRENAHIGTYTEETISNIDYLYFYIFLLQDNGNIIFKYGLTKQKSLSKRWKVSLNYDKLCFVQLPAKKALDLETLFSSKYKRSYTPARIRTTECGIYDEEAKKFIYDTIGKISNEKNKDNL